MPLFRMSHAGAAVPTTLAADITATSTSLLLAAFTGWPTGAGGPFGLVIDPGLLSEEKILCATQGGGTVAVASSGRGSDNTVAVSHSAGAVVEHCLFAAEVDDDNAHIYDNTRDDHSSYARVDGARPFTGLQGFNAGMAVIGNVTVTGNETVSGTLGVGGTLTAGGVTVAGRNLIGLLVGQVFARAGGISVAEQAYLLPCDGSAVSRATWPRLFAQIGSTYGAGDGTTTFNVPDLRDRTIYGATTVDPDSFRSPQLEAAVGGADTVTPSATNLAAHTHTVADTGHAHGTSSDSHNHAGVQGNTGSGTDFGWVVARDDPSSEGLTISSNGTRATSYNPANVVTGAAAAALLVNSASAVFASGRTGTVGTGTAFDVHGPYIAIPYFIVAA